MSRKIVMIDDDSDFLEIHKTILSKEGYEVLTSQDSTEGIKLIKDTMPDLVILDVMMGSADEGFNVARTLREDEKFANLPIILLSSINQTQDGWQFGPDERWNAIDSFIDKPVKKEELIRKVKAALS